MLLCLEHSKIDKAQWDATIAQCGNIYAYSWYLDIVHPRWEAVVEDDYQCVMPLTGGKKFGVNYLFQPFFVQQLGVFGKQPLSPEKLRAFLDAIPQKYRYAEIRLNESNLFNVDVQGVEYHRNVILDLNRDYENVKAGYHTNTKRNLAKAESFGLQVVESIDLKQVIRLFREHRGAEVKAWGDAEYGRLQRLCDEAMRRNAAFVVGTKDDTGLLCGAMFVKTDRRITFLFSGNSVSGKAKQAMTFLMDFVIQKFANQPITFDFEGSDDSNIARFYLGFGGQEAMYPSYAFNRLSPLAKAALKAWKRRKS